MDVVVPAAFFDKGDTIEAQYAGLLLSEHASDRVIHRSLFELIAIFRQQCHGTGLFAVRSLGVILSLRPMAEVDSNAAPEFIERAATVIEHVTVRAFDDGSLSVSCTCPQDWHHIPLSGNLTFHPLSALGAALTIVWIFRGFCAGHPSNGFEFRYVNDSPRLSVSGSKLVRCPHCGTHFSLKDQVLWDGDKHLFCGQKLEITPCGSGDNVSS